MSSFAYSLSLVVCIQLALLGGLSLVWRLELKDLFQHSPNVPVSVHKYYQTVRLGIWQFKYLGVLMIVGFINPLVVYGRWFPWILFVPLGVLLQFYCWYSSWIVLQLEGLPWQVTPVLPLYCPVYNCRRSLIFKAPQNGWVCTNPTCQANADHTIWNNNGEVRTRRGRENTVTALASNSRIWQAVVSSSGIYHRIPIPFTGYWIMLKLTPICGRRRVIDYAINWWWCN